MLLELLGSKICQFSYRKEIDFPLSIAVVHCSDFQEVLSEKEQALLPARELKGAEKYLALFLFADSCLFVQSFLVPLATPQSKRW